MKFEKTIKARKIYIYIYIYLYTQTHTYTSNTHCIIFEREKGRSIDKISLLVLHTVVIISYYRCCHFRPPFNEDNENYVYILVSICVK